ncbi:titin [Anopheles stephensi]|uniref:titin n=1 Tax=Anopheles stephensi TaxID=30069 RepID=UPI001658B1ED|nr:titin [Anopheles stephensi]
MPISAPKIPEGLPELMRGLAKSVIKENPENLYVHAAEYFENLIRERDGHLEQGYQTFNAYQVYADYKEKTRDKLGLTKDPSLSDGIGGDGDESGSGGSESNIRGRKRRRARKPSSREKENPATMVGNPSISDEGEPQKLKSVSGDSGPPLVPVVEQEIVKVHYNPPEAVPSPVRVVSAQSVEAEQAVSSILGDDQMLDSDGTGDELVDNRDDIGTAPSTAEITEQSRVADVAAEPGTEMTLQDMETCFMHANVDDLLEKHTADADAVGDAGEDIPEGPQLQVELLKDEGETDQQPEVEQAVKDSEDIPEGPQPREEPPKDEAEPDQQPEAEQVVKDSEETQLPEESVETLETEGETIPPPTNPVESVVETGVDVIEKPEPVEQVQAEPTKETEEIVGSITEQAEEQTLKDSVDQANAEKENTTEETFPDSTGKDTADAISDTKVDEEAKEEDPIASSAATDLVEDQKPTESASNEVETKAEKENLSTEKPEEPPTISSRMGFEEDESGAAGNDENENIVTESEPTNDDAQVQEPVKSDELNVPDQSTEVPTSDEGIKDDGDVVVGEQIEPEEANDTPVENDKPAEAALSECTSVVADETKIDELEKITKETQDDSSNRECDAAEVKVDEDPKEYSVDCTIDASQQETEPNDINITPDPTGDDANKERVEDLVESNEGVPVASAAVSEDPTPVSPATKPNEIASDPPVDPDGPGQEAESEKETTAPHKGETDDSKDGEKNEQEVNENNAKPDENALLMKDPSLEDVVHDGAEPSGSVVDAVATSGDLITEENAPTIPAEPSADELATSPEPAQEDAVKETVKDQKQESDEAKVEVEEPKAEEKRPEATDAGPTFEDVVIDEIQKVLQGSDNSKEAVKTDDGSSDTTPDGKDVEKNVMDTASSQVDEKDNDGSTMTSAPVEELKEEPEQIPPSAASVDGSSEKPENEDPVVTNQPASVEAIEPKDDTTISSPFANEPPKRDESREEVIEEPCVKREISPSKSVRLERGDSAEKQVEELEKIKKVDLSQLSKDSAEALFYTLKKSELENQEPNDGVVAEEPRTTGSEPPKQTTEDDDQDVVVKEEPPSSPAGERTKRSFTNDFLDENPITDAPTVALMPSDGVDQPAGQDRSSLEADEQQDEFNPMVMVSMRSKQFQEQLHSRGAGEPFDDEMGNIGTPKRPVMRRCMTEMSGLQRYDDVAMEDDPVDSRQDDPSYVEEEDQFDGYYIGHIKNKILASSVSVADSDCPDGTRSSVESVDENNVRTALETIASTDTESTIASQATIQQAGRRSYLRKHSQNTSSNIPYASFGNAAIDQSLDEFIEREEQHKQDEAMAEAATKIQRSYRTHKKRLLRDYHSTMRTFTEDQSAESGEEYAANVIQIKLDQRRAEADPSAVGDAGEESDTATPTAGKLGLGATGKRPMYSLNIDEYDTVARRMTLTRGVAMQRNSTPDDDSGKSANASTDRKPSLSSPAVKDTTPTVSGSGESPSSDEKPAGPDTASSSSDEREQKDAALSSSRSKPKSGPASMAPGREQHSEPVLPRTATSRTSFAPLDVQSLLLIARQRTMPVQIDSSVIRVLPKHMRKRISSAGMLNSNGKRK